jgi:hypothetical protein
MVTTPDWLRPAEAGTGEGDTSMSEVEFVVGEGVCDGDVIELAVYARLVREAVVVFGPEVVDEAVTLGKAVAVKISDTTVNNAAGNDVKRLVYEFKDTVTPTAFPNHN